MQSPSEWADQPQGLQATTSSSPAPPPPGPLPDCPVLKAPWGWEELPSGSDPGELGQEPLPRSPDFALKLSLLGCGHTATARPARHPAPGLVCPGCQEKDPGLQAWPDGQGGGLQGGRRLGWSRVTAGWREEGHRGAPGSGCLNVGLTRGPGAGPWTSPGPTEWQPDPSLPDHLPVPPISQGDPPAVIHRRAPVRRGT